MILLTGYKGFIGSHIVKRFMNKWMYMVDKIDCWQACNKDQVFWKDVSEIWQIGRAHV